MTDTNPFALAPLRDPEEPRCACILLLDVSFSMKGERLESLNRALKIFATEVASDPLSAKRVEAAIVSFGSDVRVEADFTQARDFRPLELKERGNTQMGQAVLTATDMLKDRKEVYKQNGVEYFRPWIFLITDGGPTDYGTDTWNEAVDRVREGESKKAFSFFAVGVDDAEFRPLKELCVTPPLKLKGLMFRELFKWLSVSMASISGSQPGDSVVLEDYSAWGEAPGRD
ncbi:VWA domain-containing protein [Roseibium sp. HPY-6]|uniref:vWA domain-containing protein n=1 Tax=Roseibium sp. HPY-6 TaxID=3229852 RepID=UPI00338FE9BC